MGITFQDRVSTYPNRYRLKKSDGTSEYVTLERADSPTQVGTPLNAATFNTAFAEKAPAGYGLGGVPTKTVSLSELDSTFASGWYWLSAMGTTLNGVYFNYATVFVHGMDSGACVQEIHPLLSNVVLKRYAYRNTWYEWECENPPMAVGVEYRTTERYNGKPVYKKLVNISALPNSTTLIVSHGTVVLCPISIELSSQQVNVSLNGHTAITEYKFNATDIQITSNANLSAWSATALLSYTKD